MVQKVIIRKNYSRKNRPILCKRELMIARHDGKVQNEFGKIT